jgi:spore maturation protein CgeB
VKIPERVLIVHPGPQFSVEDVFNGWYEAFCDLGIKTIQYNLQDRLLFYSHAFIYTGEDDEEGRRKFRKAFPRQEEVIGVAANQLYSTCYRWWPDLILIISDFFIPEDTIDILRSRGHKVVILFTESPYEEPKQVKRAQHADLVLVNDPSRLDLYEQAGIPAHYMPHAYRPKLHYPGPGTMGMETDFAFIGTAFPSRIEFFEKMHAAGAFDRIDVTLGGFWGSLPAGSPLFPYLSHDPAECVDNDVTAKIYRSAQLGINFYRVADGDDYQDGVACGPREIEMAACGLPFLRDSRPESDELFGEILPAFSSPEEASEQLARWLAQDELREQAALAVRAAVRPRTFTANAQKLLKILDEM